MKTLCVIPARLSSSRLPRKMLAKVQGIPMVVRTFKGAEACKDIDRIIVATDSDEIAKVLKPVGAEVVMTPKNLPTGSDRVAYVAKKFHEYNTVINLQGDEPFIQPAMLSALISPFKETMPPVMSTVAFPILTQEEYENPNFVKVITDQKGDAISFSRAPIPYLRTNTPIEKIPALHHMGLYAYQRDFLLQYTELAQTPLEKIELLEQLRALEHGYDIRVVKTHHRTLEVNTPEELEMAQSYLLEEPKEDYKNAKDLGKNHTRTIAHYSKLNSIMSILKSRELHASRFDYLEDQTEIVYAKNILSNVIYEALLQFD